MSSGRVWDNTCRLRIKRPRRRSPNLNVSDDGLIIVYQMSTHGGGDGGSAFGMGGGHGGMGGGGTSVVPCVKSLKARYEGDADGAFRPIRNVSSPIPLRACSTFASSNNQSFYFVEVPLDPSVDGPIEEIILSFDKLLVSKIEQVVIMPNDRRFIPLASSLPLENEDKHSGGGACSVRNHADTGTPTTATFAATPTTVRSSRGGGDTAGALLSSLSSGGLKLSATQKEKVLNKIKSYKRSISPNF